MDFQISALAGADFAHLFTLSDAELARHNACRQTVTRCPDVPCRISLEDAAIGETVILVNHTHQPASSPYQASHAIYVRDGAADATPDVNNVPLVIRRRLISMRCFDATHMMIDADVVPGDDLAAALADTFDNANVAYVHLHYAKPGCFAATAHRVT